MKSFGVDTELVKKLFQVARSISFAPDHRTLKINLSSDQLINEYKFTDKQLIDLYNILNGSYQYKSNFKNQEISLTDRTATRFYISNADLKSGTMAILTTAAEAGPAALMAAWISISTALAGPLGTIAGLSTAVLGSMLFADLALKITGALAQGKGPCILS